MMSEMMTGEKWVEHLPLEYQPQKTFTQIMQVLACGQLIITKKKSTHPIFHHGPNQWNVAHLA